MVPSPERDKDCPRYVPSEGSPKIGVPICDQLLLDSSRWNTLKEPLLGRSLPSVGEPTATRFPSVLKDTVRPNAAPACVPFMAGPTWNHEVAATGEKNEAAINTTAKTRRLGYPMTSASRCLATGTEPTCIE